MSTKKTLVVRLHVDVTEAPDAVIEAYKTLYRHSAKNIDMVNKTDFEVLVENEEDTLASMLQHVRNEFQAASTALFAEQATADEIEAAEKSDGYQDFLRLVTATDEDEDEAVYDEE